MAAAFLRRMACALHPLLQLSRCSAAPRALSALLPGPLAAAAPAGASLLARRLLPGPQPAVGFKTKGVLRRRCRDCYRVKRRGRWFIYCRANPRHKQRQM
ncbi:large ribosomal subunit protein bL36m isoform 1-T3 [Hipposideros larvatus]